MRAIIAHDPAPGRQGVPLETAFKDRLFRFAIRDGAAAYLARLVSGRVSAQADVAMGADKHTDIETLLARQDPRAVLVANGVGGTRRQA